MQRMLSSVCSRSTGRATCQHWLRPAAASVVSGAAARSASMPSRGVIADASIPVLDLIPTRCNRNRRRTTWHSHSTASNNSCTTGTKRFMSTTDDGNSNNSSSSMLAFDRSLKRLQRDGAALAQRKWRESAAAATGQQQEADSVSYDYFREEIASRLVDRLDDIRRDGGFPLALDIGSGPGYIHRAICADDAFDGPGGIGGVRKLVQLDSSNEMLNRDVGSDHVNGDHADSFDGSDRCSTYRLNADEESKLPFPDGTFDLVLSSASIHWVNNLPGLLSEAKRVLKPDGCLMFAMVGGSTLSELRSSLVLAEMERDGGVSTHVGPFVDFADVGTLLTAAGFTLPTVDIDTIKLGYPNAMVLMEHLQRMGEGNACASRRTDRISADMFLSAACVYDEMFKLEVDDGVHDDESIEASIQIIYAIGWTPDDSQQKPLERGSATRKIGEDVVVDKTTPGGSSE
mmetsp:Transcript_26759/g.58043  ORF Transcript_26759/g.58043 Transcript_26759/m.58043 type:complete len:458 (+) Transcript_26759:206-1579(+)